MGLPTSTTVPYQPRRRRGSGARGERGDHVLRARLLVVFMAAAVQSTGLQAITPALPAMQSAMGLNNSQIALVTTAYLLPTSLLAFPLGALADRLGRRIVLSTALLMLGFCGLGIVLLQQSPLLVLLLRVLQGAAVGALLPITITIIGDSVAGRTQVRAQAWRNVAMKIGGAVSPAAGGVLAGIAWQAPFLLELAAIPIGVAAIFTVAPGRVGSTAGKGVALHDLAVWCRNTGHLALSAAAFLRLFLTFSILTYLPIIVVSRGMSAVVAGIALSLSAALGALTALAANWLAARFTTIAIICVCQIAIIAAIIVLAEGTGVEAVLITATLYGSGDGALSVLVNSLVSAAAPPGLRGTVVGINGAVKNLGKFMAPAAMGVMAISVPLVNAYLVVAGVGLIGLGALKPLSRLRATREITK